MSRKAAALVAALALIPCLSALAEGSDPASAGEGAYYARPFVVGDQTISIEVGAQIPLFTFGGNATTTETKQYTGAGFGFAYQRFVAPGLAIGGSIEGSFNQTYGARSLFIAPLAFRTAYWWTLKSFEIGLVVEPGIYLMRLSGNTAFGPILKAGGIFDWRVSNGWSVGLDAMYWFVPEIHTGAIADETRFGNFLKVGIVASYHL